MTTAGRAAIGGACALAIAMSVGRFAYTLLLPWMQAESGFGPAEAGFLASANLVGYLIGALAAAALPGGWRRVAVLRASLILSAATTLLMGAVSGYEAWVVLRFTAGLASAGVLIAASDLVVGFARRTGRAGLVGVHFSGVGIGIVASSLVVAAVAPAGGASWGWIALGAACFALMPLCWRWLAEEPRDGAIATGAEPVPAVGARVLVTALFVAYFCQGAGYVVTGTFLVALVRDIPALAPFGAYFWMAVGLAAAPSTLLWSAVGRRTGPLLALVFAHGLQAFGIVLPVVAPDAPGVLASALLFGGTFMGITTLTVSFGGALARRNRARIIGGLTAGFGVGQALGPAAAGTLAAATGGYAAALIAAAAVVAGGAAALLLGRAWAARRGVDPTSRAGR